MLLGQFRLVVFCGLLYVAVGHGSAYLIAHMQRQLEVSSCKMAAHADRSSADHCDVLSRQPIKIQP